MDDGSVRLRVNRTEKEVEIAGPEDFVREFAGRLGELLGGSTVSSKNPPQAKTKTSAAPPADEAGSDVPETFGAYLHRFPDSINNNDRMLIAAHFVQVHSDDSSFKTRAASDLLVEQGVKLPNPSNCVKRNREAKRVFNLAKGQYRVSKTGEKHLQELLTPAE